MGVTEASDCSDYKSLQDALELVCGYACDNFILDCTNGITLRDEHGTAICGGYDKIARHLFLIITERRLSKSTTILNAIG